jgi:methionyl-tRNA formyltransferase
MSALKIIFMGTPDFSVPALQGLINAGHDIVAVYCQPPRKSGRGMSERLSPVHQFAEDHGLTVLTPLNFKQALTVQAFADHGADVAVVVAYGLILPEAVLKAPRHGCFNIHASLLPRWRGAAPIQRAIMAGDAHSGVTIMQMDAGLDTGDMVMTQQVAIGTDTTAASLHDELSKLGGILMVQALECLQQGDLTATPQSKEGITYAHKISKSEGRIDWHRPAEEINRHIRALTPWPGAWFEAEQSDKAFRIKVKKAHVIEGNGAPGEVLDNHFTIACCSRALRIEQVQREGKSPASAEDFLRGFSVLPGTKVD